MEYISSVREIMQILSYFHPDSFDIRSCEQQIYCSVLQMKTDEMKFHIICSRKAH